MPEKRKSPDRPIYPKTPDGFYKVSVILSEKEYRELRSAAVLMPRGTFNEAIRKRLGLTLQPHGFVKAMQEMYGEY